jgi:hypothetical protein
MKKLILLLQLLLFIAVTDAISQNNWQFTYIYTGGYTIYDLASSSSPQWIVQDPLTPDNIHVILMTSPYNDLTYSLRRIAYYFSSDKGVNWTYSGDVVNSKSGFPCLAVASDGSAIVSQHVSSGMTVNTLVYKDAAPGLGSFSALGSPIANLMFGRICVTSSYTLPVKIVFLGSPLGTDTVLRKTFGTAWSSSNFVCNSTPEAYTMARGKDGRIGITYIDRNLNSGDWGSVFFTESTNNGLNFSVPVKIFQPNPADSLSAYRGISIAYKNNSACISFEIANQELPAAELIKAPAKIMFWNPQLSGTDPNRSVAIAHKNNVWIPSPDSIKTDVNDQFTTLCRPVVGVSSDTNIIYVAFQMFTNKWGGSAELTNYKALYLTRAEGNFNFSVPRKITPDSPLRDWSYPSMSPWNEKAGLSDYAYICALSDSIPGTFVNATANGQDSAKLFFIKAMYTTVGIKQINETAESYNLSQNYPNPFNPSTKIQFSIAKAGNVKLTVYDILGKEVNILVNEYKSQGTYAVDFEAPHLSSGVYFYKISTGTFSDVKKMFLLK